MHPYIKMAFFGAFWSVLASIVSIFVGGIRHNQLFEDYVREYGYGGSTNLLLSLSFETIILYSLFLITMVVFIFPFISSIVGKPPKYIFGFILFFVVGFATFRPTMSFWTLTLVPAVLAFGAVFLTGRAGQRLLDERDGIPQPNVSV